MPESAFVLSLRHFPSPKQIWRSRRIAVYLRLKFAYPPGRMIPSTRFIPKVFLIGPGFPPANHARFRKAWTDLHGARKRGHSFEGGSRDLAKERFIMFGSLVSGVKRLKRQRGVPGECAFVFVCLSFRRCVFVFCVLSSVLFVCWVSWRCVQHREISEGKR